MHKAKDEPGYRWSVVGHGVQSGPTFSTLIEDADYFRVCRFDDLPEGDMAFYMPGVPMPPEVGERFATLEEARSRADELNDADVVASLNIAPKFVIRRKRLQALGETFNVWIGTGPREARWPREPEKYAANEWSDRHSMSWWTTYDTLADVEEAVLTGDVQRIVDLDTGEDVPFALTARAGVDAAAQLEP